MKKILICLLSSTLALLIGAFIVVETTLILPTQYDDVYLAELADKYARLRSVDDEQKVVIIGGSSVSFGLNTALMEDELGMPVVNFGMYGPLGTTVMLDLCRGHVNKGDIIIIAPETDTQTMSMEFNGDGMWQAIDNDYTLLFKIRYHNWDEMLGSFWTYATQKWQYYNTAKPETSGVYSHDSFNEYGDMVYTRTENVMDGGWDETVPINLTQDTVEDEFIDYLNDFIDYCQARGATVYYSWPPMNELAVQQNTDEALVFSTWMCESLHCKVISNITDYIMDAGYFYDTNYHMNDSGVIVHTMRLLQDLENVMGDGELVEMPEVTAPPMQAEGGLMPNGAMPMPVGHNSDNTDLDAHVAPPPGETDVADASGEAESSSDMSDNVVDAADVTNEDSGQDTTDAIPAVEATPVPDGSSVDADCFTYESYNEGLLITGVTDAGADRDSLEIPWRIDGELVIAIGESAFANCTQLKELYIQSNVTRIMQGAFDNCPTLTSIHIDNENGANILIPGVSLFDNVPARTQVYIPQEYYGSYVADYFWGNYLDRLNAE